MRHRGLEEVLTASLGQTVGYGGTIQISWIDSAITNGTFRSLKRAFVNASPASLLEIQTPEFILEKYPNRSAATSNPRYIARHGSFFFFGPDAAVGTSVIITVYSRPDNLSVSNTTNWFTDNAPELLLYGSLLAAEPFILGDPRIQVWKALYDQAFHAIQYEETQQRRYGPMSAAKVL